MSGGSVNVPVSGADFRYVCGLLRDDSAIELADDKGYLVESRLAPLAASRGVGSVANLVELLRGGAPGLRHHVVEALANNETFFFRDVHPFEALRHEIIPAILRANGGRRLAMWSAAASTGQEAYSLAMLVREHFPAIADSTTILATDFSLAALARAESGKFTQLEVNRGLPASLLVDHFERHGREWRVHEDVRRMVTFRQLNLARPFPQMAAMDVIFLRNVLIYFDRATKVAVLKEVAQVMRPSGYLFMGATETTYGIDDSYERLTIGRSVCYRRPAPREGTSDASNR